MSLYPREGGDPERYTQRLFSTLWAPAFAGAQA